MSQLDDIKTHEIKCLGEQSHTHRGPAYIVHEGDSPDEYVYMPDYRTDEMTTPYEFETCAQALEWAEDLRDFAYDIDVRPWAYWIVDSPNISNVLVDR